MNDNEQNICTSDSGTRNRSNFSRGRSAQSRGRRPRDVSHQKHHRESGELRRSHHACSRGKAAGLVETLEGAGPFTFFAPTNEAFAKVPAATVDTLLKPENKPTLTKILTYHLVAGRLSASDLKKQIEAGKGRAELTTVEGGKLWASQDGNRIILKDEKGVTTLVTNPNVFQSNGVIHVVDTV